MRNSLNLGSTYDLLSVTAFFSAFVHAVVILGVSFKLPDIKSITNTDNTLDVVLINRANDEEPVFAETVSVNNNSGGGLDKKEASSPLPYKPVNPSQIESVKKTANQTPRTSVPPEQLITADSAKVAIEKPAPKKEDNLKSKPTAQGPDRITTKSQRQLERERLIAKLNQSFEEYQKRPKKEFLSPSSKQHEAALYLANWHKKIVRVGNANYPIQARAKGLSGTLIVTIEINRNGTVHSIKINNPSPHKLLNDAATRFLRDAAPYDAFPAEIDAETDILVITRAFHFLKNNQLTSSDASGQK